MFEHDPGKPERGLPLDPDLEADEGSAGEPVPIHLNWRFIGLVFLGGVFGTAARHVLGDAVGTIHHFPLGTFIINIAGAFALGLLLEWLVLDGLDAGRRRGIRLLIGTGFLGGFTTYSALAVDTDSLLRSDHLPMAAGYAVGTVVLGLFASVAGIAVARKAAQA